MTKLVLIASLLVPTLALADAPKKDTTTKTDKPAADDKSKDTAKDGSKDAKKDTSKDTKDTSKDAKTKK